ncbi:tRNA (cytidine(32)/uridine(32)-2'-O)-methyltransferase [hydrothermal vent metagenome]|uniref:tRNA (Cytidine(32)/uridine(32)-2'-O)-methyltransferase n=1 Tax=hydrothermal vent metagenome TaxID=652676 RepID=A0A3B0V0X6_9ZZZZ
MVFYASYLIRQASRKIRVTDNIQFVLLGTTHAGNIGAAARAMKTMGINKLVLVNPEGFPSAQATARASGADDLLFNAEVCDSMDMAIRHSKLVIGTTARKRHLDIPVIDARVAAELLVKESKQHNVSLVFGKERYGMTNEEVERCHYLVRLPTVASFSSLNLASAVQVLAYECQMARLAGVGINDKEHIDEDLVNAEVMESFYQHYFTVMEQALYLRKQGHESIKTKVRLMYNRTRLKRHEIDILRGFLSKLEKKL